MAKLTFKVLSVAGLKTFYNGLMTKITNKFVAKVDGKGLSEVDVTTAMKEGWDEAEKNVIVGLNVKKGDTETPVSIDEATRTGVITVPDKFSDLLNDLSGDDTLLNQKFYTDNIAPAIAAVKDGSLKITKVDTLPVDADLDPTNIYLVPKVSENPEEGNIYEEYIVLVTTTGEGESAVTTKVAEKIGETKIDLTNYLEINDVEAITDEEIMAIFTEDENA